MEVLSLEPGAVMWWSLDYQVLASLEDEGERSQRAKVLESPACYTNDPVCHHYHPLCNSHAPQAIMTVHFPRIALLWPFY